MKRCFSATRGAQLQQQAVYFQVALMLLVLEREKDELHLQSRRLFSAICIALQVVCVGGGPAAKITVCREALITGFDTSWSHNCSSMIHSTLAHSDHHLKELSALHVRALLCRICTARGDFVLRAMPISLARTKQLIRCTTCTQHAPIHLMPLCVAKDEGEWF